jgi:hypothetical protein
MGEARGSERREATRYFTCYPFHIQKGDAGDTGDMEIAVIQDLSARGAYLLVTTDLEVGARVKLHLDFGERPGEVVVEGRVLRTERRPADVADLWLFGAAVQFSDLGPTMEAAIQELAKKVASSP